MKTKTIFGALGVIVKNNKILMALRHQPDYLPFHRKWEFPGGEVEFPERPEETVVREIAEEVKIKTSVVSLLPYVVVSYIKKDNLFSKAILLVYVCRLIKGQPQPSSQEVEKVKWFSFSEINYSRCLPFTREIIETLLKSNYVVN